MSRKVTKTQYSSIRIGALAAGCRVCVTGAKLVLLATGVCSSRCWYCPLSERKKNKDVIVANEWWVKSDREIIEEARLCDAKGAGITGGDPLCRLTRTIHYIKLLKRRLGRGFHIHLYTTTRHANASILRRLYTAGLDEIRFHPEFLKEKPDLKPIVEALKYDWDVGCEIPVIPGHMMATKRFLKAIDNIGVKFVNLNQLEVSETNAKAMECRGYGAESDVSFAVRGSEKMALDLLRFCAKNTRLRVHYCTVKLKDGVQLRNRLKRRAKNVAKEYDIITNEGLLIRGAVYLPKTLPSFDYRNRVDNMRAKDKVAHRKRLQEVLSRMRREYRLPAKLAEVDGERLRILTGAWVVEELADELKNLGLKPTVIEEYPTWDRLIIDLREL